MDDSLRNSLWNFIHDFFQRYETWGLGLRAIALGVLKIPVDSVPYQNEYRAHRWLHGRYFELTWFEVYNLIEFMVANARGFSHGHYESTQLADAWNVVLKREMSAYRFISGRLVPISNEIEVATIEEAMSRSGSKGLEGVHTHLATSLNFLRQKPEPDYRNSIKEAISAVESAVKLISGRAGGGLDDALTQLAKKTPIHGALRAAFLNLYGYTSDENGIRHAMLDDPNVGFDEAKFMLVACSAFVNYLISKSDHTET